MKRIFIFRCLLLMAAVLSAIWSYAGTAYPYPVQVNQPDGTTLTVILQGDENLSWAQSIDGYTLLYNAEGIYEYAILDNSGNLVRSGNKAHDISARAPSEKAFLQTVQKGIFYSSSQNKVPSQPLKNFFSIR